MTPKLCFLKFDSGTDGHYLVNVNNEYKTASFLTSKCIEPNFTIFLSLQILEMNPEDEAEEDGANIDLDSQRKGKCVVLKTSTRQVN